MYFLLTNHVLFTYLYRTPSSWLSHFKIPKYYKVFINKKKYKACAISSDLFFFIWNWNNKPQKNKKVNFWRNYLSAFYGASPLFSSRKFPQVQKRAKRKTKRGIRVFDCPFWHQTQNKLTDTLLNAPKVNFKPF